MTSYSVNITRWRDAKSATTLFRWADTMLSIISLATGKEWVWTFGVHADEIKFTEREEKVNE